MFGLVPVSGLAHFMLTLLTHKRFNLATVGNLGVSSQIGAIKVYERKEAQLIYRVTLLKIDALIHVIRIKHPLLYSL